MHVKTIISGIVIALTLAGYIPYIRDILKRKTKPHAFTWFSVALTAGVAYGLQVVGGAGVGAIPMLAVSAICVLVFVLSLFYGTKDIKKADILFLLLSLVALYLWLVVKQPLWSIVLITLSEVLGYIPTIRKSWHDPYSETLSLYEISMFRHALAILALEKINILTALYPTAWAATNLGITIMLIMRRRRKQSSTTVSQSKHLN